MAEASPRAIRSIRCILNPRARQGSRRDEIAGALDAACSAKGVTVSLDTVSEGGDLTALARRAASEADVVVAVGGDGTVSSVARGVIGTGAALGVLPMGTLNHFAKDLGIPVELEAAARVLVDGATRRVDVGDASGRLFLNTATLGAYFEFVRTRDRWQPRIGKRLAHLLAIFAVLRHPPVMKADIEVDGRRMRGRVPLLWVGNNEYEQQWPDVGTRQRLDGDCLTLVVVHDAGRWELVKQVVSVLRGRSHLAEHIDVSRVKSVTVRSRLHHLRVAIDGERVHARQPLEITVKPLALSVRVPADRAPDAEASAGVVA